MNERSVCLILLEFSNSDDLGSKNVSRPYFFLLQNHQDDTIEDIEGHENNDEEEVDVDTDDSDDDEDALLLLQNLGLQSLQSKTKR